MSGGIEEGQDIMKKKKKENGDDNIDREDNEERLIGKEIVKKDLDNNVGKGEGEERNEEKNNKRGRVEKK